MEIFRSTRVVDAIIDSDVQEILEWYGFPLSPRDMNLTMEQLCDRYDVDIEDLLVDLEYDDEESYTREDEREWELEY